jgi:ATP-dependent RNA/DNA helicase IGHMBP2
LFVGIRMNDEKHPHLLALTAALTSEEAWQREEHARLLRLPLDERVAVGVSWAPLRVEAVEEAGRGRVVVRLRSPVPLHDGIASGDLVTLAPEGSPDAGLEGTSLGAEGKIAEVLVDGPFDDARNQAVTKRFDATTFHRMRGALSRAFTSPNALGDVLLGRRAPSEPPGVDRGLPARGKLNQPQLEAAVHALSAAEIALIHGPPGTGKTEVITSILRGLADGGDKPWALADSNAAVDHLAIRAARSGLEVVRVGHPARVGSDAAALTVDARIAAGPAAKVLKDLDRAIIRLRSDPAAAARAERRALLAERDRIADQARDAVLAKAQVIAVTLGTLLRVAPDLPRPHTAVVDESTQAVEPGIWGAVPFVERLILVGDPHQLGPVVMEPGNPLQASLLERLLADGRLPMPMLAVQHRMHAAIQALVQPVYAGGLVAHASVEGHLLRDLPGVATTDLTSRPVLWVDTAGAGHDEQRDPVTRSLFNEGEIAVIAKAAALLRDAGVGPDRIGVIAPYSAQVARLAAEPSLRGVEVATVNAFQGREKDAILCTFVRSNPDGDLGFVADPRRLTVALTRARRFLLCTGDSTTLGTHGDFARVMDTIQAQDGWMTVWEPPWAE